MYYIIVSIFTLIATIGLHLLVRIVPVDERHPWWGKPQFAPLGVWLIVTMFSSLTQVPTGNIGVVRTFGSVDTVNLLSEGLHVVMPWQSVFTVDNRTTKT